MLSHVRHVLVLSHVRHVFMLGTCQCYARVKRLPVVSHARRVSVLCAYCPMLGACVNTTHTIGVL